MANFEEAYLITLAHEGEYSNDPVDVGGETYKGISRKFWPDWPGWLIVDEAKNSSLFPHNLSSNPQLQSLVKEFYRITFWDKFWGDKIQVQFLANELFDTGVNMGISRAITFLQKSLNLLNRNGQTYPDIDEDGKFGTQTFGTLNTFLRNDSPSLLYKFLNVMQGCHYIEYMKKSPSQERFARGWFSRVDFIKHDH